MIRWINSIHAGFYRRIFGWMAERHPPRPRPIQLSPRSRVLVFTCAGIGDTLTDSVVFKALAETFPGIHCAAVVHHRRRALVEHNPYVNQIFSFRKGPLSFWSLHRALAQAGPWDAILHLRGNDPEPRCQSFLLDPTVTVSVPNMTTLEHLCAHHVEQPDWDQTHGVEQTLRIARYVGATTKNPELVYRVNPDEKNALEKKLASFDLKNKNRVILQIGGGRRASWRDWPTEHWAKLVHLLSESAFKRDMDVILSGGSDHYETAMEIGGDYADLTKAKKVIMPAYDLVGQLTLTESAALLASAKAVVSTDTGIMHLAFAVGVPVVALIHCNNPASRVGPYGYGDRHRVVQLPRPAHYQTPADANMANLSPELVLKNLEEILK